MIKFLKKYWFIVFLAFFAFFLLGLKWFLSQKALPVIKNIDPPSGAKVDADLKEINVEFEVNASDLLWGLEIQVEPPIGFTTSTDGRFFKIKLKESLFAEIDYSWKLTYFKKTLLSWVYNVNPLPTPSVAEVGDPDFTKELIETTVDDYPLIRFMPYSDNNFAINYSAPKKLVVKIKGVNIEAIKAEVLAWISSKGVDPETHQIEWR